MRGVAFLATLVLFLAGCSGDGAPKDPEEDPFEDTPEAAAGKGLIRGLVVTPAIVPVQGATIRLTNVDVNQTSDVNGAFVFADLEPGEYFLQVSKPGWTSVQQSASVVADEQEPPIVKVAIDKLPGPEPRVMTLQQDGYMACSYGTPLTYDTCAVGQDENPNVYFDIEGTPRWLQTEIIWDSTQPSGDWLYLVQGICSCDNDVPPVGGARFNETPDAESPYVAWATPEFLTEWEVGTDAGKQVVVSVSASGPEPETTNGSGVALNQGFSVYVTFFYNFDPDGAWSFSADGPYPVPPT